MTAVQPCTNLRGQQSRVEKQRLKKKHHQAPTPNSGPVVTDQTSQSCGYRKWKVWLILWQALQISYLYCKMKKKKKTYRGSAELQCCVVLCCACLWRFLSLLTLRHCFEVSGWTFFAFLKSNKPYAVFTTGEKPGTICQVQRACSSFWPIKFEHDGSKDVSTAAGWIAINFGTDVVASRSSE